MGKIGEHNLSHFEFRLAQPSDYQAILDHLRENFCRDEQVSQVAAYSKEGAAQFDQKIISYLTENLSFLAIDTKTNHIAGIRIIYESCQDEYSSCPLIGLEKDKIFTFLAELEDKCNIFSMFEVSRCAKILLTSVCREFRGQGIGTEMYRRSVEMLRQKGFGMIKGAFCNPDSIQVALKFGFYELARSYITDYRDKNGDLAFPNANIEFVALMALKI